MARIPESELERLRREVSVWCAWWRRPAWS